MAKHHVDPQTGATGPCGASVKKCPYGGDSGTDNHYDSKEAAEAAGQVILEELYGEFSTVSKKDAEPVVEEEDAPVSDEEVDAVDDDDIEEEEDPAPVIITKGRHSFEVPTIKAKEGYMGGSGFVGSKLQPGYNPPTKIAKLIRDDLKKATAVGYLPEGLKYSVRAKDGSLHIDVIGLGSDRDIYEYNTDSYRPRKQLKKEYQETVNKVEAIYNGYNYNAGNAQYDYSDRGFYGRVSVETEKDTAWKELEKARSALVRVTNQKTLTLSRKEIHADPEVKDAYNSYFEKEESYYIAASFDDVEYRYVEDHGARNIDWAEIERKAKATADKRIQSSRDDYAKKVARDNASG